MSENYGNVSSKYERTLELGVIQFCTNNCLDIDTFVKFENNEKGYEDQGLVYRLIIKSGSQESINELSSLFNFCILDSNEGRYTLVNTLEFPAIDNILYKERYMEEFKRVVDYCNMFVTKIEDELGISADGLLNEDRFASGIFCGKILCLVGEENW